MASSNGPVDASAWEPTRPHCEHCETDLVELDRVSAQQARQYDRMWGDENHAVPACPACTDPASGQAGCHDVPAAIKVAITAYGGES